MTDRTFPSANERLRLKQATGWFPAGDAFRKALYLLSDGAFRLFAYLCLEADRRTGRIRATHQQLAAALGKSKRAIGTYVAELESQGVCHVKTGKNQFAGTIFEISESYWPYHRTANSPESPEQKSYVDTVREYFLALGCVSGKFGSAEAAVAKDLHRRGIPLGVLQDAMLMGARRKYTSWFEGRAPEPIRTLSYFESLIAEVQEKPFPPGYSAYLRKKVRQFGELWNESVRSGKADQERGCPDTPAKEIVQ
jgi:hypothetical protein